MRGGIQDPFSLSLHSFLFLPTTRKTLEKVCRFISYDWADYWFTNQMYNENAFKNLSEILKPYKKALHSLENHWEQEPSVLNIPRSNQCAERAIKVMQELYAACRNKDKLQLRFTLTNNQWCTNIRTGVSSFVVCIIIHAYYIMHI